jgi:23S rRNA-/tRNA-specific pseudouridylate synthase
MKDRYALIEAYPQTGRTHQIRVHLAVSSLPIVGDATYGGEKSERMLLHVNAWCCQAETRRRFVCMPPWMTCIKDGLTVASACCCDCG